MPSNLTEAMSVVSDSDARQVDPVTTQPYEYHVTSKTKFELCATFQAEPSAIYSHSYGDDNSAESRLHRHKKGHQCFEFSATP